MRLTIGEWLVDPASNEISRGSEVQRLEPKTVEVFLALARRAGEVVSREQLLSDVWNGMAVSDDALTQCVIKLRKALGDTSKQPSYIQTIPKRGYRLVADVGPGEGAAAVVAASAPPVRSRKAVAVVLISVMAGALAAFAAYRLLPSAARHDTASVASPARAIGDFPEDLPRVVVRPFAEAEGDQLQNLLARGFTARLITDLGRFPDIRVISFRTVGASAEDEPARQTGYAVAGEVQRQGDNIRLYVHLADAASGRALWSEQYDRPYSDLFTLQDELTRQVVGALRLKVSDAELARRARPYTRSLEAYEHFLRAQSALIVRREAENGLARELYSKAIQLDPTFARAYAGLALTYAADRRNRWTEDAAASLAKAFDLAQTARQIDPDAAEVRFALAYVQMERGAFADALEELRTALRLTPSYADAYALLGAIHTYQGQPAETIPLIRTAMRLVPDSGQLYYLILGRAHFFLGDASSAVLRLRQAMTRNPENLEIRIYLAAALVAAGQRGDAAWEAEEIRALEPGFSIREWLKTYPMSDAAQIGRLTAAVGTLGL